MRLRAGPLLCLLLLVPLLPLSADAAPRFTRLGSDSAEGNAGPDLLYLDVAQRDRSLIVKVGVDEDRPAREQNRNSLIRWNFSVDARRTFQLEALPGDEHYRLLETTETDTEVCAEEVAELPGSFDPERGVVRVKAPLRLIGARAGSLIGTYNHNECYEGVPEVRSYLLVEAEPAGTVYFERSDEFEIGRTFRIR